MSALKTENIGTGLHFRCAHLQKYYREVMGATNPEKAAEGTIRKMFAVSMGENSVHGSDSDENAAREISFFFSECDIVG